jgi:hypothetical protein
MPCMHDDARISWHGHCDLVHIRADTCRCVRIATFLWKMMLLSMSARCKQVKRVFLTCVLVLGHAAQLSADHLLLLLLLLGQQSRNFAVHSYGIVTQYAAMHARWRDLHHMQAACGWHPSSPTFAQDLTYYHLPGTEAATEHAALWCWL